MGKKKRRHYTPEFKAEAVKRVTEQGVSATQAAKDLGISQPMLPRWVKRAREAAQPVPVHPRGEGHRVYRAAVPDLASRPLGLLRVARCHAEPAGQ